MDKAALEKFAVYARNKLREDVTLRASLVGVKAGGIDEPLTETPDLMTFDIGLSKPHRISSVQVRQRKDLVAELEHRSSQGSYEQAFDGLIEEVAYTWFNRMIALRFMEVNDYLPNHIRVLSSVRENDNVPEIINRVFETGFDFSTAEREFILKQKEDGSTRAIDELYNFLFICVCNEMHALLPELFEKTDDYMELLFEASFVDEEGVIYKLVHEIAEEDFDVESEDGNGQVEIIGWLYQYYNSEPRDQIINIIKKTAIDKQDIPAATQLFTTDWVVRYMVDNSLGKYWLERNPDSSIRDHLTYLIAQDLSYIDDPVQPEDIKVLDNCMGSGHCLVYAFDVLMLIYTSLGYSERDAASSILNNNLYGLDIDKRAFQLAYFSIMMKGRQYNKGIYNDVTDLHIYEITESNELEDSHLFTFREHLRPDLKAEFTRLIELFTNAKSTGSLIQVDDLAIKELISQIDKALTYGQQSFTGLNLTNSLDKIVNILDVAEVLQNKYQVVVTNPPYMNRFEPSLKSFLKTVYKDYSGDLFAAFIYQNTLLCVKDGYSAYMSPYVWMFIKTYEKLRNYVIQNMNISSVIQMEYSAFEEATVPICTFVLKKSEDDMGDYIRLSDFTGGMEVQGKKTLEAINNPLCSYRYYVNQKNLKTIPGSPIAYWAPKSILEAFENGTPMQDVCSPKQGLATTNNKEYLRLWWEVPIQSIRFDAKSTEDALIKHVTWVPYNKGGARRQWYGNYDYVVNWADDGAKIKSDVMRKYPYLNTPDFVVKNTYTYFQESITWSLITSGGFSIRYRESGSIHDVAGMSAFSKDHRILLYCLGLLSTKVANYIFKMLNPTLNLQVGDFANFPVLVDDNHMNNVITISNACTSVSKEEWDSYETSWNFKVHPLVQRYVDLRTAYNKWATVASDRFKLVQENENKLNSIFITLYGLTDELDPFVDDQDITLQRANKEEDIRSLISYAVGCMFGRYSLDEEGLIFAGGEWDSSKYKSFIPDADGILPITDDAYFENDITSRFVDFIKTVYGQDTLEENLNFIADALGSKGEESRAVIRNYFLTDFFQDHCKTYSVHGSGKRPIYWLYDSGKQNGFKALIYMHRYNDQTHATVRVKYLHELQKKYRSSIDSLENEINRTANAHTKKTVEDRLNKIIKQLDECTEYDEMLGHIANERISIDLDDGFKVNHEKVQTDRNGKCWQILAKIR